MGRAISTLVSLAAATAAGEDPQLSECWLNNQVEEGARLQGNDNGPGSLSSEGVYMVGPGEVGEGDVHGHTRGWGVGKGGQLCPVAKVVDEAESQGRDLGRGVWSIAGTFGAAMSTGVQSCGRAAGLQGLGRKMGKNLSACLSIQRSCERGWVRWTG